MLNGFLSRSDGIEVGGGVRADPVALALVGLGVAWLIAENTGLLDRLMPDRIPDAIDEPTRPADKITALSAAEAPQSDQR